ncbi:MAG: tRNA guanosine(34) transglycosylase Tgt [Deltaproteobacteria bacterium]|nr:tRNA guanosine(34) transglycosylase Tgt [Deltaproteobacteria bacterium]
MTLQNGEKSSGFTLRGADGKARMGSFATSNGRFDTPNFMPVGTRGSVKGVDCERLHEAGAQIMLVNTYHLWLRPGPETVERLGGIHKFTGWNGPILSDSGGFQIFSLRHIRKVSEEGVEFRSHIDGALCFLSPELAVDIQEQLGVDIAMVLDECPAAGIGRADLEKSLEMTLRWAARSLNARKKSTTSVFAITQGGLHPDLRRRAAHALAQHPFDGFAIGGLSVGEKKESMYEVLSYHVKDLPGHKIRYLMGVGTPEDIVQAVSEGVDLFDCVMPTRAGRFGRAFIDSDEPHINIKNSRFALDREPLDGSCPCLACLNYSRGYLHHLFKVGEMLGPQLLSLHNLTHYLRLMAEIREKITAGEFAALHKEMRKRWKNFELEVEK